MATPIPDEQAALLAAIVADRDDDTPRLVYADWLQEHGDTEQAEFIRDSIALAQADLTDEDWAAWAKRLRTTRDDSGPKWLERIGLGRRIAGFSRGLLASVSFEGANEFFAAAERLFALVPVRSLEICSYSGSRLDNEGLNRLTAMPELSRLTRLSLLEHAGIGSDSWRKLLHSPHLAELEFLGLSGCDLHEAEVVAVAVSPSLSNLTDLDLSYNSISAGGARALIESPFLRKRLERLWLSYEDALFIQNDGEGEVFQALLNWLGEGLRLHESAGDESEEEL